MRVKHWLVVWGDSVSNIRGATGISHIDAMNGAFGLARPNMTAIELTLYQMRTGKHRAQKLVDLLRMHDRTIRNLTGPGEEERERVVLAVRAEIAQIKKNNPTVE